MKNSIRALLVIVAIGFGIVGQESAVPGSTKSHGGCEGHMTSHVISCLLNGKKSFGSIDAADMQKLTSAQRSQLQAKFTIVPGKTGEFIYAPNSTDQNILALAQVYKTQVDDNHYLMGVLFGYNCQHTKQQYYANKDAQYKADQQAATVILAQYKISDPCK